MSENVVDLVVARKIEWPDDITEEMIEDVNLHAYNAFGVESVFGLDNEFLAVMIHLASVDEGPGFKRINERQIVRMKGYLNDLSAKFGIAFETWGECVVGTDIYYNGADCSLIYMSWEALNE